MNYGHQHPGASWESHHAYKAWVGNTWLCQDMIEDYFGKSASLEELVDQWTTDCREKDTNAFLKKHDVRSPIVPWPSTGVIMNRGQPLPTTACSAGPIYPSPDFTR